MKMQIEIIRPRYVNFIRIKAIGFQGSLDVGNMTDGELEEYADKYKQGFIEHAKKRRDDA